MKKITLFGDSIFNAYQNGCDTTVITDGLIKALNCPVENLSISGATTVEAMDRLNRIDPNSELVILEFGTNDAASAWGIELEKYQTNLEKIIASIGAERMIITGLSYPDPNNEEINRYYGAKRIRQYNQAAKKAATSKNIPFVNLVAAFANLKDISSYYLEDGQHLTDKGNELLISILLKAIKEKLQ